MFPIHSILCPLDFSDPSHEALGIAREWAREARAELHLIHVVRPAPVFSLEARSSTLIPFDVERYEQALVAAANRRLQEIAEQSKEQGVRVEIHVAVGHPVHEILRAIEALNASVVIISTHGRTGWDRLVTGSVTEKVVRHATCPVLVLPLRLGSVANEGRTRRT